MHLLQINAKTQFGLTPLHLACQRANVAAVTALLKCKHIDINIPDENQDTPLHEASLNGHYEIVEMLLEHIGKSDVATFNPQNSELKTPLHFACHEGQVEVVQLLLNHDYRRVSYLIETEDNEKNTALHLACESGNVTIVSILVAMGANLLATKFGDVSPIHVAARHGFTSIANELMNKGDAILDMTDSDQQTPLHYAATHNQVEMIQFLLEQ